MVVEHPPFLEDSVENVRVVMPIFCKAVVDQDCMQVVGSLLLLDIGLLQDLFNALDLLF